MTHLLPHFSFEEEVVYPVLGLTDPLIEQALHAHQRIVALFQNLYEPARTLMHIVDELEAHIRFEEQVLFQHIQEVATPTQLARIERVHALMFPLTK